ncbi:MAG: enoyl-CoA hydratase [Methyloligellaceae bacterium]
MQEKLESGDKLIGAREGSVATITFNNPAKHNAVSLDMWEAMDGLLAAYESDPDVRVLVVTGAGGKAFVSGADISKFESERATREAVAQYNRTAQGAYERLYRFPKPTIAKIRGYCIGGGVNLAACCDLRYCTQGSRFAIPAARLGLGYGYAGLKKLVEIIGVSRALEMFYTARQFSSEEAFQMGLVNGVAADDALDGFIDELTQRISANAPLTIATIKRAAREISRDPDERDLAAVEAMVQACFESEDYVEGRRAFMEKRKPAFKGR